MVEIDEMFLCHRKYNVGRRTVKEGTWVLGMTEVDASSHPIENPDALHKLQERREKRERAARKRDERRKHMKRQQVITRLSSFPSAFSGRAAERTVQAPQPGFRARARRGRASDVNNSEDEAEQDHVDLVHIEEDGNDDLESFLSRIQFERQMSRLFSQSRNNQSKMTLFFILPDRKRPCTGSLPRTSSRGPRSTWTNGRTILVWTSLGLSARPFATKDVSADSSLRETWQFV